MDFDLYTWVYLITNLFTLAIVHRFMGAFFDEIIKPKWHIIISYALYFVFTSAMYLIWDIPVLAMIVNLILLFVITLNYGSSLRKKFFVVIFFYIFMLVTEVIVSAVTGYFSFLAFNSGSYSNVTGLVVMRIIAYLESIIFYNIKSLKRNDGVALKQWIATLFIPISTLAIKIFIVDTGNATKMQVILSTIIILLINLITFFLYNSLAKSYAKEKETALISKEKEMYYNQCLLMQETNEHLQAFRHEINNQFISMKELINKRMYNELDAFVEKLTDKLEIEKIYSNTGNVVVDSIINYKLNLLNNANVVTEIAVPSSLEVDINDLVIILGNILDNAVKALNENEQDSKLYFKLVYSQGRLLIKETNTYKTRICYENGKIQSSKADKVNHGLGLKNVEDAVKRHDGYMEINHNDNIFSIDIILFV